jgi:DNA-binding response OmpR family regulator
MRILVVEDDPNVRASLAELLAAMGHDVVAVASYAAGLAQALRGGWDIVLTDAVLPGGSGIDLARRAVAGGIPTVICTGNPQAMHQLAGSGISFLQKPFTAEELERAIGAAHP